jgi:hypothetical protein
MAPSLVQIMQILFTLLHLISSMLACSNIFIMAMIPAEDIGDISYLRTKLYKNLVYFSGLIMIFSGIPLLMIMRSKLSKIIIPQRLSKDTPDIQSWVNYFPIKFVLTITLTPFLDRLIKLFVNGISTPLESGSHQDPQDYYDSLSSEDALANRTLDRQIALIKAFMVIVLYAYSSYIKH